MNKIHSLSDLETLKKNYTPRLKKEKLSPGQAFKLKTLLYGVRAYPGSYVLNRADRFRIQDRSNAAWEMINKLHQERLNRMVSTIIMNTIPEINGNAVPLLLTPVYHDGYRVELPQLQIPQDKLIQLLISAGLLPMDFYQL